MTTPDTARGMASRVADPVVVVAVDFARRFGLRISESTLRAAFDAHPATGHLRLADMVQVFHRLGVPLAAFAPARGALRALPLPLVAVLAAPEGQLPVTLFEWSGDRVGIAHPFAGETWLTEDAFAAGWAGTILAAPSAGAGAEADFASRDAADRAARERYRQSVRVLDDWASPDECRTLINLCERSALFGRSTIRRQGDLAHRFVSGNRTSESAYLHDRAIPVAATLLARAAALLGVGDGAIEDLQCVRYLPGQQFGAHVDGAHRTFTLLVYLNHGFEGGQTVFPDLDLAVAPRAGRALLFRNVDCVGGEIPWSRHLGASPSAGTKYACNLWVRCPPEHVPPAQGR